MIGGREFRRNEVRISFRVEGILSRKFRDVREFINKDCIILFSGGMIF